MHGHVLELELSASPCRDELDVARGPFSLSRYENVPEIEVGIQLPGRILGQLEQFAQFASGAPVALDHEVEAQACIAFCMLAIIA
jgi:hypothetical protein